MNNSVYAKANSADLAEMSNKIHSFDFYTLALQGDFSGVGINSGTLPGAQGEVNHPGMATLKSSTSANSGYCVYTNNYSIVLNGGETFTVIIKTPTSMAGTTIRAGLHYAKTEVAPTDGIYCEILGTTLTGKTAKASTISTTASNYTIATGTWYRLVVKLNSTKTLVTFTLFADDSNTVLWTDTLSTNIPTTAIGAIILAVNSGTTAVDLLYLDYIAFTIPNTRRVV